MSEKLIRIICLRFMSEKLIRIRDIKKVVYFLGVGPVFTGPALFCFQEF